MKNLLISGPNACLHATAASGKPNESLQMIPNLLEEQISILPTNLSFPPTNLISFPLQVSIWC